MTGSELLVQRFLDSELSAEERVRFVVQLGRDGALRRRVIDLEQLALEVSRIPRPVVPDGFVARVMEQTAAPSSPLWRRIADTLWAPRALQWNLASAVAVTCVALLVGSLVARMSWRPASERHGTDVPVTAAATARSAPVLVRLVILQPGARTVHAVGDFNGWSPSRTPLEQASSGAWTVTIPLEPGRYEYMFVVDGRQWIGDPFAAEQNDDGFGSRNAVLDVRPPMGETL